jgi:cytochrome c peroxidase
MLLLICVNCSTSGQNTRSPITQLRERIRADFGVELPDQPVPVNNPSNREKVFLGEALFFDPNLSSCGTVACATCHLPEMGFSDGERISTGCSGASGRRNSNTIYNTTFLSHLFWDGRVQSLEQQALGPIVDPAEMSNTWDNVIHYIKTGEHLTTGKSFPDSARFYERYFNKVFEGEINSTNVAKAVSDYERTVVTFDSPYDRWVKGDDSALSNPQKRGALVFFGRGKCSECHVPPTFTDGEFHNVGVPSTGFEKPEMYPFNHQICGGIPADIDPGRAEVPFLQTSTSDLGRFKTPTLRNVELTAPYMHNGRFLNLDEVIRHYWNVGRGTTAATLGKLDSKVEFVRLSDFGGHPEDFYILTEFLKALTGSQVDPPARGISPPTEEIIESNK